MLFLLAVELYWETDDHFAYTVILVTTCTSKDPSVSLFARHLRADWDNRVSVLSLNGNGALFCVLDAKGSKYSVEWWTCLAFFPLITCPFSPRQPVAATDPHTVTQRAHILSSISKGWAIQNSFSLNGTKELPGGEIWREKIYLHFFSVNVFVELAFGKRQWIPFYLIVIKRVGRN